MEKMMPMIDAKIIELREQMDALPTGDLKADIPKLVGQLKQIRGELDQVNEQGKKLNQY